jgi:hypothetical protein
MYRIRIINIAFLYKLQLDLERFGLLLGGFTLS